MSFCTPFGDREGGSISLHLWQRNFARGGSISLHWVAELIAFGTAVELPSLSISTAWKSPTERVFASIRIRTLDITVEDVGDHRCRLRVRLREFWIAAWCGAAPFRHP